MLKQVGFNPNLQKEYKIAISANRQDRLYYFHANHLGSGSLITDNQGNTCQTLAYAPYGEDLVNIRSRNDYDEPYKFTGYERDVESGLDYAGARYYDGGWFKSTDPMWYKYPNITPYAYCGNNPIKYIDPTGLAPIYDSDGNFLGTDDEGIAGAQLILDKADFKQGMAHADAQKALWAGEMNEEAHARMDKHVAGLSSRPDYDGFVDVSEGIAWAKAHPGALQNPTPDNTLYIDASKLNFGDLSTADFAQEGVPTPQNLFEQSLVKSTLLYGRRATVYALGRVDMILENREARTISIVNNEATDYDWNVGGGTKRDAFIRAERWRAGLNDSHGFKTYYYSVGKLKK